MVRSLTDWKSKHPEEKVVIPSLLSLSVIHGDNDVTWSYWSYWRHLYIGCHSP